MDPFTKKSINFQKNFTTFRSLLKCPFTVSLSLKKKFIADNKQQVKHLTFEGCLLSNPSSIILEKIDVNKKLILRLFQYFAI